MCMCMSHWEADLELHARRWQGTTPDMTTLYISALDTLYQVRYAPSLWPVVCLVISACNGASSCKMALSSSGSLFDLALSPTRPESQEVRVCALQVSPTTLFFVEGGGQLPYSMCWGDGFVTDKTIIAANSISDPNPFFTTLSSKPYLNNVVISPHYYPPSISKATSA